MSSTGHPPILESRRIVWSDEGDCAATAARIASQPEVRRAFIELRGTLGAGKTTFVRHLLHALGVPGRIKSPSYAVVEPYEIDGFDAWHFDFYRFDDPQEWEDAGLRDMFATEGLKVAEWPEKAEGLLPPPDLRLSIAIRDDERRDVAVDALSERGRALLR